MARPRTGLRASLRAVLALLATALVTTSWGQTTSGNAGNGGTLYTAHCASCHTNPQSPYPAQQNGANAGPIVSSAIAAGMVAPWVGLVAPGDYNDLAAYIANNTPAPATVAVAFNSPGTVFALPAVVLGGAYVNLTSVVLVSGPSNGSVIFSGTTATYTPTAGYSGPDSFTWQAIKGSLTTSTRTTNLTIANPPAPTLTPATVNGSTGTAVNFFITASPVVTGCSVFSGTLPPGLSIGFSSGSCTIVGTPTATASGTTVQIKGTNAGGTGAAATFTFNISLGLPVVTSGTPPAGQELVSYVGPYSVTASNGPITAYFATGLPPGLGINAGTGQITGTPTLTGGPWPQNYVATLSASNATGTGPTTTRTFTINKPVPQLSGAASASGQTGVVFTPYVLTASPGPILSYNAVGLPAGLSINGSGQIVGTPTTVGGPTVATLTATNSAGTSAGFPVSITITLGPPVVNSAATASGGELNPFSYQITATNGPLTGYGLTGTLPTGVTFNSATGVISGTPAAASGSAAGTHYVVTISATNATGTSVGASLDISVSAQAPVITSALTASGQTGIPFSYQIAASFAPTSFNAIGLPPGLAVNATGLISGTPTAATTPTATATISATNGSGTDSKPLVFTITLGPPVVTSSGTASGAVGFPLNYQITASNSPSTFGASGLPPGLAVNASGLISGTPTTNGTFTATVTAANSTATATKTVVFTIGVGLPAITSSTTTSVSTGYPFSFQIVATNGPTSFAATGLPAGVTLNPTSGLISGSFSSAGAYVIGLQATNATGSGTGTLTVTVIQGAPGFTSPASATASVGQPFSYVVTVANGPATISVGALPPGLAFDALTGTISGIATAGGTFTVPVTISNSAATISATLTITVAFLAPTTADSTVQVAYETATPVPLALSGQVLQLTIVSMPSHGLLTVTGTQVVYTPANGFSGTDSFTYTAANPAGTTAVTTVTLNVGTQIPVAVATAMQCEVNSSASADLSKVVKGSGLTGVTITTVPLHGKVTVNGMVVTYTPNTDYFGPDGFFYVAFGNAGKSNRAYILVKVTGRPDPTKDANVRGLVDAQAQAARRYSAAQVGNFQRRMETLHRTPPPVESAPAAEAPATPARVSASGDAAKAPMAGASPDRGTTAPVLGSMVGSLVAPFVSAAATRSFDLNGSTGGGGGNGPAAAGFNAWIGGTAQFGRRTETSELAPLRFTTDGLSIGLDRRFGERVVLGLGFGYGQDETRVGTEGSRSKSKGQSFALYGSFQPSGGTFVDVLLGMGKLDFDNRRHVSALDQIASGTRRGEQSFASIASGIELRREGVLFSPYARVDATQDRLKGYDEQGVGDYALHFDEMRVRSTQVAAGLRLETQHDADFGSVQPRFRVEYRRELQDDARATLRYADLVAGPQYSVTSTGVSRNALLLGVGSDFVFRGGLRVGVDYVAQRASGAANVQGVRVMASLDLDGRGSPFAWQPRMFKDPIGVEAGYTFDDNVSRGRVNGEKLGDDVFSLAVGEPIPIKLGSISRMRLVVTPQVQGDKFRLYTGLGKVSAGAQAELQYRGSGAFDATTYALVGRATYDQYESTLRRGARYFAGLDARRSLTDRIDVFAEAGHAWRQGKSEVFRTREWVGKLNLDYSLGGKRGLLYLAGEYRRGDTFASGGPSLVNVGLADVFVPDDAFASLGFFAYRFDARTALGTVGWNYPLGPRDSIDLSWRRVQTTPTGKTAWDSGTLRYIYNQYSLVYLMRF